MARTTKELIDELEKEGRKFIASFLVCRFDTHVEYVEHSEVNKLDKLNEIVVRGGIPFALIGYIEDESASALNVYSRLLGEFEGDNEAMSFLQETLPTISHASEKSGLTPHYLPAGQWLE